jgi:TatD DNase family protein
MIIDMHCHIDLYDNPQKIIRDCNNYNIYVLSVTTTPKAWEVTNKICNTNNKIKTALGFHPQIVSQRHKEIDLFDELLPKVKYVGEIGLDGSYELKESFDKQLLIFRRILESIKKIGGKIMSIHSRNATRSVLEELKHSEGIPILHWFSGNRIELDKAIQQGCWFSVGLPMIFSKKGRMIISSIPKERLLTETDAPFNKYNNNILMPWDVELIFPELSHIWNISIEESIEIVSSNFRNLLTNI